MKTILTITSALTALLFASCETTTPAHSSAAPTMPTIVKPANTNKVIPYTSDKCIVTDNKLGSMGDPITIVHGNQEVKFCCKPCVKEFKDSPDEFLKKLN